MEVINNNPMVYLGWSKITFIERDDSSEEITFKKGILSFAEGSFSSYVDKVEEIRSGISYEKNKQEFLVNGSLIFCLTLGTYGNIEYLCKYTERQIDEKEFGDQMLELSRWAKVPWHIAKITKGMSMVEGYEVLSAIKKVASSDPLSNTERSFLMKKDLKLRLAILESLFSKKVWNRIKDAVTRSETNSRYLAYYIMCKGEIEDDINVFCDLPKGFYPNSATDIYRYNMNFRTLKAGVGINFALCTADIEDNCEAIQFLKHMKNVIAATKIRKGDARLFCSEDDYYRNATIRYYLGEEIWALIGNALLSNTACSFAIGHYIYLNHRRGR